MSAVLTLAWKDLRLLWRDRTGFFFTFGFPLVYAVFFGYIMSGFGGNDARLSIVVVDDDATERSRAFVERLEADDALIVQRAALDAAEQTVRRGNAVACVRLPAGFGAASARIFWGAPPTIEAGFDPSRRAESGILSGLLTRHMAARFQEAFTHPRHMVDQIEAALGAVNTDSGMPAAERMPLQLFLPALRHFLESLPADAATGTSESGFSGFEPVHIATREITRQRRGPLNAYEISFPQAIVWGVMGCAAAFGISLVVERSHGTLLRLCVAPLGQRQILAGKALACFTTTTVVAAALLALGTAAFGLRPHAPVLLAVVVLCMSAAFVGLMMLLSTLGRTEQSTGGIGWSAFMVMAMVGGGMFPLAFLPPALQTVSNFSPVKWSIYAMEGALWRQLGWTEVLPACGILLGCGVVSFAIGQWLFRWD